MYHKSYLCLNSTLTAFFPDFGQKEAFLIHKKNHTATNYLKSIVSNSTAKSYFCKFCKMELSLEWNLKRYFESIHQKSRKHVV